MALREKVPSRVKDAAVAVGGTAVQVTLTVVFFVMLVNVNTLGNTEHHWALDMGVAMASETTFPPANAEAELSSTKTVSPTVLLETTGQLAEATYVGSVPTRKRAAAAAW